MRYTFESATEVMNDFTSTPSKRRSALKFLDRLEDEWAEEQAELHRQKEIEEMEEARLENAYED